MSKKAFISCSFDKKDLKVSKFFFDLVKAAGLEPIWAKPSEGGKKIPSKITEKLDQADFAVGIFSQRSKIENIDEWTTVPSVIYEMGQATKAGKTILGFVEESVPREQLGLIHYEGHDIPQFDRNNLGSKKAEFKKYIKSAMGQSALFQSNYRFLSYTKDLTLYKNGYGIARYICGMESLSNSFKQVKHEFGLGSSAIKGTSLPKFNSLQKNSNVTNRWEQKPFFKLKTIDLPSSLRSDLIKCECSEESSEKYKFIIDFGGQLKKGKVINYEWSIGTPGLFPTTKKDMKLQVENKGICESHTTLFEENKNVCIVLRFEETIDFEEAPTIEFYDRGGNVISTVAMDFTPQKSTIYNNFVVKLNPSEYTPCSAIAKWIPK